MDEPVVATENVVGAVGAAVTELSVVGTVSGAIGGSILGLSASRTSTGVVGDRSWEQVLLGRCLVRLEGRWRA